MEITLNIFFYIYISQNYTKIPALIDTILNGKRVYEILLHNIWVNYISKNVIYLVAYRTSMCESMNKKEQ